MFSTRRRCTASSSAIKIVAAMAFPATCNYVSRFGALKPTAINVLLRGVATAVLFMPTSLTTQKNRFEPYGLAFSRPLHFFRATQTPRRQIIEGKDSVEGREIARVES